MLGLTCLIEFLDLEKTLDELFQRFEPPKVIMKLDLHHESTINDLTNRLFDLAFEALF